MSADREPELKLNKPLITTVEESSRRAALIEASTLSLSKAGEIAERLRGQGEIAEANAVLKAILEISSAILQTASQGKK